MTLPHFLHFILSLNALSKVSTSFINVRLTSTPVSWICGVNDIAKPRSMDTDTLCKDVNNSLKTQKILIGKTKKSKELTP
jgi:hypothetical protein